MMKLAKKCVARIGLRIIPGISAHYKRKVSMKLSSYEVGKIALTILTFKISNQGLELKPREFAQHVTKNSQRIGCPREELLEFFNKFLVPEVLHSCELKGHYDDSEMTEREAVLAYRLLKMGFFWDLRGLRDEVNRIVENTPLSFDEVAPIVNHIALRHLNDQFGKSDTITLDISGDFELR